MVYPDSCTAVCYVIVITLFIKNVGVVTPNFGGPDPLTSPVVASLIAKNDWMHEPTRHFSFGWVECRNCAVLTEWLILCRYGVTVRSMSCVTVLKIECIKYRYVHFLLKIYQRVHFRERSEILRFECEIWFEMRPPLIFFISTFLHLRKKVSDHSFEDNFSCRPMLAGTADPVCRRVALSDPQQTFVDA